MSKNLCQEEKEIISNIFTKTFYEITYFNGIPYVSHLLLKLLDNSGILNLLKRSDFSADAIISELNFASQSKYSLEWILSFLHQYNYIQQVENSDVKQYHYDSPFLIEPEKLYRKILEIDKTIDPSCIFMDYVIKEYSNFLKGYKTGFEIVFSSNKMVFWSNYFSNNNSGYTVYNQLGAFGVTKWLDNKSKIKILELGGGTGSASELLIFYLKERSMIGNIKEYTFSDISPFFLRSGNIAIMKHAPQDFQYTLKLLDFNSPLIEQGIKKNDFEVVYGVNTLHVAKNLLRSLREIHKIIKPGGLIIIAESIRDHQNDLLVQEIIFNLLDDYTNVEIDPYLRTTPGFLPYAQWPKILRASGFSDIEIILNTDGLIFEKKPNVYPKLAAVIKGVKG